MIEHNTKKCGIAEFFDAAVSSSDVQRGKPFPDIYLLAAEKLGVPIEECYIFEDSNNGVKGGVESGGKVVMVLDTSEPEEFAKENSIGIFDDMSEALKAIKAGSI